jgi:hypothetical protein
MKQVKGWRHFDRGLRPCETLAEKKTGRWIRCPARTRPLRKSPEPVPSLWLADGRQPFSQCPCLSLIPWFRPCEARAAAFRRARSGTPFNRRCITLPAFIFSVKKISYVAKYRTTRLAPNARELFEAMRATAAKVEAQTPDELGRGDSPLPLVDIWCVILANVVLGEFLTTSRRLVCLPG